MTQRLVLCLALSLATAGCAVQLGTARAAIWDTASLELKCPLGELCIGCYQGEPVAQPIDIPITVRTKESDNPAAFRGRLVPTLDTVTEDTESQPEPPEEPTP